MRRVPLALTALLATTSAHALTVLTTGRQAVFRADSAFVRFGKDRAFATLADPTCAGGAVSKLQLASYPQATARVAASTDVTLDCTRWRRVGGRYVYEDPAGTALGARRIEYGRTKLLIQLGGPGYTPFPGPVGYAEVWLTLGEARLLGRFHGFRKNTATLLVVRKASAAGANGEAAFWDVLHGDDRSEARQEDAIRLLRRAARHDRRDGRSWFLLAMMHLYRFGRFTTSYASVSDDARREVDLSCRAFQKAVPLLWDGQHGDSRVPGFAAAAKFVKGFVDGDDALAAAGLADLDAAVAVNAFFNVFDLIPVIQALPRTDPRFQAAVDAVVTYLDDPGTLACASPTPPLGQPEICGNAGLAPRNQSGSLILFGDVYAKAGNLERAQFWYTLADVVTRLSGPGYRFQAVVDDRLANAAARVAAYLDDDPGNDPPVVGLGGENCATCHNR